MKTALNRTNLVLCLLVLLGTLLVTNRKTSAVIQIQQGSTTGKLPPDHPQLGPESPTVNPQVNQRLMQRTLEMMHQNRTAFMKHIELSKLRLLALQNDDQVKILDSWARQSLDTICGHGAIEGQDPVYTALDMALRPQAWDDTNFIYIQAIPLREKLGQLVTSRKQRKRLLEQGTVSPAFLEDSSVRGMLTSIGDRDNRLSDSINQIWTGYATFIELKQSLAMLPPPIGHHKTWHNPFDMLVGNNPKLQQFAVHGFLPLPGYNQVSEGHIALSLDRLQHGWRTNNVTMANRGIASLCSYLPLVNPEVYPSLFKRKVEHWYNMAYAGTIVGVFVYFLALTLFLIAAVGAAPGVSKAAFGFFTAAVLVHAGFMATRWWLAGRIPIQNEFESVLGSAFAGCVVGWFLERWKRNNIFGLAFSFVGFLAMTACFVTPYVLHKNIGENIGRVKGVLSSYWLYMHVNVVISSYALIGASFCLGVLYLLTRLWYDAHPVVEPAGAVALAAAGGGGGDDRQMAAGSDDDAGAIGQRGGSSMNAIAAHRNRFLQQLDSANIVVLQMAFWFLGTGIALGAIWADKSWGRPWGWDPKETFALVTWIVYLIIVHLRFVTPKYRASWTAWLSVAGFGVMMFNWIGVNFFLVGLHSYA